MMQKMLKIAFKAAKCVAYLLVALILYVPAVLVLSAYLPYIALREAASQSKIRRAIRHGGHKRSSSHRVRPATLKTDAARDLS